MKQTYLIFSICLLLFNSLLSSCIDNSNKIDISKPVFFDLNAYFQQEIKELNQVESKIRKKVAIGTQQEEKILMINDWKTEFTPFLNSAINKPSYIDKYKVDSVLNNTQQLVELQYRALDEELKTQSIAIKFNNTHQVHSIVVINHSKNDVYNATETLEYIPRERYSILKTQDVVLFDKEDYRIDGFWIKE
ncbi:MAG: hypothetical protein MK212_10495 [Saprospiraceae bacterium]|nr:hypothetical protein [Saprospiraceae bacterium]